MRHATVRFLMAYVRRVCVHTFTYTTNSLLNITELILRLFHLEEYRTKSSERVEYYLILVARYAI